MFKVFLQCAIKVGDTKPSCLQIYYSHFYSNLEKMIWSQAAQKQDAVSSDHNIQNEETTTIGKSNSFIILSSGQVSE